MTGSSVSDDERDDRELAHLYRSWKEAADDFRKDGDESISGAIEACADELAQKLRFCNVPGCEEPLADEGVLCPFHEDERRSLDTGTDGGGGATSDD